MRKMLGIALLAVVSQTQAGEYLLKIKDEHKESFLSSKKSFQIREFFTIGQGTFAVADLSEEQLQTLNKDNAIDTIEPNKIFKAISQFSKDTPQDSDFKKQWGLRNTGWNSGGIFFPGKKGMDINALEAWKITRGSKDVKIAVIDTGVDYTHPDLVANIMVNEAEKNGRPNHDDDGNGYVDDIYGYDFANNDNDPMDQHGHGTHCAGVIGASHNTMGIAGVMAQVQILPIQFLGANGSGTLAGAVRAIDYAISRGVHIMSNSWGAGGTSKTLEEAVARAESAGILFVAAAGNDGQDNDIRDTIPANIPVDNVVSVGAMDGKGRKASFSNYGKSKVHVFAPGVDIYSTVTNGRYKKMSGTSMACPHIAGVAGLMLANDPAMSFKELKAKLMESTRPGDGLGSYSASGLIDAFGALNN